MSGLRLGPSQRVPRDGAYLGSGKDPRGGGGLVARIRRVCRLYKQDMDLAAGHRTMLDALWHHKHFALFQGDRAVPKFDVECAGEHKEKIVRIVMLVPVE